MYAICIEPDDNGTFLVTCPDLPEVTTFGDDEDDAVRRAADAIEEALAARIARHEDAPAPSRTGDSQVRSDRQTGPEPASISRQQAVSLRPLTIAKVELYRTAQFTGTTKAELARRLGWGAAQVDRLFDLRYRSQIEEIDLALRAMGKRLEVSVQDAA